MAVRTITPGLRARPLLPFSSGFGGPKAHSEHYPFANELLRVCCSLIHSASHALRFWPFDVQILICLRALKHYTLHHEDKTQSEICYIELGREV